MIVPQEPYKPESKKAKIVYYTLMVALMIGIMVTVGYIILSNGGIQDRDVVSFVPTDIQLLLMMTPLIIMIIAATIMVIVYYLKEKGSPVLSEEVKHK